MTMHGVRAVTGRLPYDSEQAPRLRLKPTASRTGCVDGAWWPRSDDLCDELQALLAAFSGRLGAITRATYNPTEWAPASSHVHTGEHDVELEGTHLQNAGTLTMAGVDGRQILLVVVSHCCHPDVAYETMTAAAAADDASTVDDLLMVSAAERKARMRVAAAQRQWAAHD